MSGFRDAGGPRETGGRREAVWAGGASFWRAGVLTMLCWPAEELAGPLQLPGAPSTHTRQLWTARRPQTGLCTPAPSRPPEMEQEQGRSEIYTYESANLVYSAGWSVSWAAPARSPARARPGPAPCRAAALPTG